MVLVKVSDIKLNIDLDEKAAFESGKIHIFGVLYYKSHEPYVE